MAFLDNFRTARWVRTANLLLQAFLFLTLFGGLNYLAGNHTWRYDLKPALPLSPETLAYVQNLPRPVALTVTAAESATSPEVSGLLREYAYATEADEDHKISVEYLDVDTNRHRTQELGVDQPGLLLVRSGGKRRVLHLDELYQMHDGERASFQGEQMITAAILEVANPERKKIYFLVGHKELRPDDVDPTSGLSVAGEELRQRDYAVDTLDLTLARQVPPDASLLIAVWPQAPYTAFEQEALRQYLEASAGRLILFLAPGSPPELQELLHDWGVVVDDDLLRDTGPNNITEDGDLVIGAIQPHPITQALINYGLKLRIGPARTVRPDPARAAGDGLDVRVLAASSPSSWGEVSYRSQSQTSAYIPGADLRPQSGWEPPDGLGVAVAAERVAGHDNLPFSVPRGRLVVFGTGDLIANGRISNAGALDIFLGAVNWTVDRDIQLGIHARPIERFQLALSAGDLAHLRLSLLFALPAATGLLGLVVYWTRRN
jgi:ABC-type uncharacterized transport system